MSVPSCGCKKNSAKAVSGQLFWWLMKVMPKKSSRCATRISKANTNANKTKTRPTHKTKTTTATTTTITKTNKIKKHAHKQKQTFGE